MTILSSLAQSMLDCRSNHEAQKCAEIVLKKVGVVALRSIIFNGPKGSLRHLQKVWTLCPCSVSHILLFVLIFKDPYCVKAIMAKAESLYNLCDFEHALVLFTKGAKLAPDSDGIQAGILKCKNTILNKISDKDVFFFSGSKHFIDYLRKQGDTSIDSFINDDDTEEEKTGRRLSL